MQTQQGFHSLALALALSLHLLAPPSEALATGATVGPGYTRTSWKLSGKCPSEHPYAYDHGTKCCSKFVRLFGCTQGSGEKLQFEDDANCCQPVDAVDCPVKAEQNICTSLNVEAAPCPLALGSKCCPQFRRSSACPITSEGGVGGVELGDPVECCDDTPMDCPFLPLPCGRPESRCYHTSVADMNHAEADSFCEGNKMTKANFKSMDELKATLDSNVNFTDNTYKAWTSLAPSSAHHSQMGDCFNAGCDGLFHLNDGSTLYSYATAGFRLFFGESPHTGCFAVGYDGDNHDEYIVWESPDCAWNFRAVCLCSA